ncbi:MAG: Sec-independent protein translocase protein TatB [Kiloniellales bacterium]
MFDIGWSEMAVIAFIALIVIGPKELPNAMRAMAKWTRKARSLARDFQSGIDDLVREADLDEARKTFDATKTFDIDKAVEDTIDPTGSLREEAEELEDTMRREPEAEAAAAETAEDQAVDAAAAETAEGQAVDAAEDTEQAGGSVVEHPVNIAPPHSLKPPPEDAAAAPEGPAAADSDSSQQRA